MVNYKLLGLIGFAGLASFFLLKQMKGEPATQGINKAEQVITPTTGWIAAQSPYIPNNAATDAALGNNNPYNGGPQQIPNANAANADYSPWGGTISQGGSMFAWINGMNVRNPSADLVFDRGLGVYR